MHDPVGRRFTPSLFPGRGPLVRPLAADEPGLGLRLRLPTLASLGLAGLHELLGGVLVGERDRVARHALVEGVVDARGGAVALEGRGGPEELLACDGLEVLLDFGAAWLAGVANGKHPRAVGVRNSRLGVERSLQLAQDGSGVRVLLPQRLHSDARCLDGALVVEAVADQDIVLVYGCGRAALQTLDGDVLTDVVDVRLECGSGRRAASLPACRN